MRWGLIFILTVMLVGVLPAQAQNAVITAEVVYPSVAFFSVPNANAPKLGEVPQGTVLVVHQRENDYKGEWVRATANGITGWVDTMYLYMSDAQWKSQIPTLNLYDLRNPAYVENDTLPLPLIAETGWCRNGFINFRVEPYRDAEIIHFIDDGKMVEVTGLAKINGSWSDFVRARHLETGIEGWIYGNCIGSDFENVLYWYNVHLPVITFNTIAPADGMTAITTKNTYLFFFPNRIFQSCGSDRHYISPNYTPIPSNTTVQVIGRNSCTTREFCWFQVVYNGQFGWIYSLDFEDDYMSLPITG